MKKILFSTFFSTLLWGAAADAVDHSAEFEAARLQKALFENRGADPVTFDVLSHYVDFVATGTTKVVTPLPGHTFQGTDAPRIGIKNYNSNNAVALPLKRTITLLPGERTDYEVPFPHYVSGVAGATLRTVAWRTSDALEVVVNSGVNDAPASTAFATTPKDVAQQLRYYKKYFMNDRACTEAEIIADFLSQGSGVTDTKRAEEVIITLTSYPARFATTWLAIESLLRQTERPDRVNLNLFEGEFPGRVLPWFIKQQMKRGLEINWCPENLKVYLKVIPTVQKFPNAAVVATDDDVIYPQDRLHNLMDGYRMHPDCVIAQDVRIVGKQGNIILPINLWKFSGWIQDSPALPPSYDYIPEGVFGILFPPNSLMQGFSSRIDYSFIAPSDDDLWGYVCIVCNGKKVYKIKSNSFIKNIDNTQDIETSLWITNFADDRAVLNSSFKRAFDRYLSQVFGADFTFCENILQYKLVSESKKQFSHYQIDASFPTRYLHAPVTFLKGFGVLESSGIWMANNICTLALHANIGLNLSVSLDVKPYVPNKHYTQFSIMKEEGGTLLEGNLDEKTNKINFQVNMAKNPEYITFSFEKLMSPRMFGALDHRLLACLIQAFTVRPI